MPGTTAGRCPMHFSWPTSHVSGACLLAIAAGVTASYGADAELGRYLSSECMTCHGTATSDTTIPNIFGLGQARFAEALKAYRAKSLPNPVMQTVAGRLNDDDIASLALFFETARKSK